MSLHSCLVSCVALITMCTANSLFAQQSYQEVKKSWEELQAQVEEVQAEFSAAEAVERPALRKEFSTIVDKLRALLPSLRAAGIAEYLAHPNEDEELTQNLAGIAWQEVQDDLCLRAFKVTEMLLENKCDIKGIYDVAGLASFRTNHFDKAEKYFEIASKNKTLSQTGREFAAMIPETKVKWERELALRKKEAEADDLPRVKMETTKGDVVIELFENEAPQTVGNFISLIDKGFYNGLKFHRVISGFMAQGGDPQGTGSGGPGYKIYCECNREEKRDHFAGSLAMAHAGLNSGGSQFYLTYRPTPHLDGQHTVFGRIIEGLDVIGDLNSYEPSRVQEGTADRITKITILRKRGHEYSAVKVNDF